MARWRGGVGPRVCFGAGWACGRGDGAWVSLFVARWPGAWAPAGGVLIGRPSACALAAMLPVWHGGAGGRAARGAGGASQTGSTGGTIYRCSVDFDVDVMGSSRALPSWIPEPAQRQRVQQLQKVPGSLRGRFRSGSAELAGRRYKGYQRRQRLRSACGRRTRRMNCSMAAQQRVNPPLAVGGGLVPGWPRRVCAVARRGRVTGDLRR
jgi:hypothetical protein